MNINSIATQLGSLLTSSITSSQAITYREDLNVLQVVEADHKSKVDAKAVEVLNGIVKTQSFQQLKLHEQVILCDNLWKVRSKTEFAFDPRRTMGALFDEHWDLDSLQEINAFSKKYKMALFNHFGLGEADSAIMGAYTRTIKNTMTQPANGSQFETRTVCYCLLADLRSHFGLHDNHVNLFFHNVQLELEEDICGALMQHVNNNRALLEKRIAEVEYPDFSWMNKERRVREKIRVDLTQSGSNCLDKMMPKITKKYGFGIVRQFIYTKAVIEADLYQLTTERSLEIVASIIKRVCFLILNQISETTVQTEISERIPLLNSVIPEGVISIMEDYLGLECVFQALLRESLRDPDIVDWNCEMLWELLHNTNVTQASKLRVLQFVDMCALENPLANVWAQQTIEHMSVLGYLKADVMKKPAWHFATEMLKYYEANPSPTRKTDSLLKLLKG